MSRRVWASAIAGPLLPLVEYAHATGADLDADLGDPDIPVTVEVAQLLSLAASRVDMVWPSTDATLLPFVQREGRTAPGPQLWTLAAVEGGRLGLVVQRGVIETSGEQLTHVQTPEPDRYAAYYYLPNLYYLGSERGHRRW